MQRKHQESGDMNETSGVSVISTIESEPTELLKSLIEQVGGDDWTLMNLATIDSEFGILNRNVVFRGMAKDDETGENILFITERNSRKYKNLKDNAKVAITFLFPEIVNAGCTPQVWQVRLFDAEAIECDESQISALWAKEPLFAKIRSHIAECGKPVEHTEFIERHDKLLKDYANGKNALERTKTFTVFKVLARRWDFYMSEKNKIGDRLQYCKNTYNRSEEWQIIHVEP